MGMVQGTSKQRASLRAKRKPVRRAIKAKLTPPTGPTTAPAAEAPWPMPAVVVPTFPDHVIDIRDHGATGDDQFDCTAAIARAIDTCADAGGGRVLIPPGRWFTGPIHLRSNIELHLAQGATVRFSSNPTDYLPPVFVRWSGQECFNFSPLIYARNCTNIAITGRGVLLGQGQTWWQWEKREKRTMTQLYQMVVDGVPSERRCFGTEDNPLRPQFILPINCTNVLLEDFVVAEGGPFWTIHLAYCHDVTIRRLNINATEGPNNDGIVVDSCENVIVEDCDLKTREDCVALKSGLNEDGQRVGKPTKNVVVRRIRASAGAGAIAIGSDMSGGVRNVLVHDCVFDGPAIGVRLKAARGRGGVVEDVVIQNIQMGQILQDAIQLTTEYASFVSPNGKAPVFRNLLFREMTCAKAKTAVRMIGLPESALRNITLEGINISSEEGLVCNSGNGIRLVNVNITPVTGPVLSLRDSQDVLIQGLNNANGATVFLDLRGRQTRGIRLHGEPNDHVRPAVVLGLDVPKDALVHE